MINISPPFLAMIHRLQEDVQDYANQENEKPIERIQKMLEDNVKMVVDEIINKDPVSSTVRQLETLLKRFHIFLFPFLVFFSFSSFSFSESSFFLFLSRLRMALLASKENSAEKLQKALLFLDKFANYVPVPRSKKENSFELRKRLEFLLLRESGFIFFFIFFFLFFILFLPSKKKKKKKAKKPKFLSNTSSPPVSPPPPSPISNISTPSSLLFGEKGSKIYVFLCYYWPTKLVKYIDVWIW